MSVIPLHGGIALEILFFVAADASRVFSLWMLLGGTLDLGSRIERQRRPTPLSLLGVHSSSSCWLKGLGGGAACIDRINDDGPCVGNMP